jgi:hypothetical protein
VLHNTTLKKFVKSVFHNTTPEKFISKYQTEAPTTAQGEILPQESTPTPNGSNTGLKDGKYATLDYFDYSSTPGKYTTAVVTVKRIWFKEKYTSGARAPRSANEYGKRIWQTRKGQTSKSSTQVQTASHESANQRLLTHVQAIPMKSPVGTNQRLLTRDPDTDNKVPPENTASLKRADNQSQTSCQEVPACYPDSLVVK